MKNNKFFKIIYSWFDMIILDHGFLRLLYHNFHKVDGNIYRSNMPTPLRIKKYKKLGIKTIINLRGGKKDGGWFLENEACKKNNIILVNLVARSRSAPEKEMIIETNKLFQKIKYPALIHCKSGADRAGIVSALYKLLYCDQHPSIAKKQLSIKFLHIKWAKTGILDKFISEYEKHYKKYKGSNFIDWVNNNYDPKKLEKEFKENKLIDKFLFRVLGRE